MTTIQTTHRRFHVVESYALIKSEFDFDHSPLIAVVERIVHYNRSFDKAVPNITENIPILIRKDSIIEIIDTDHIKSYET